MLKIALLAPIHNSLYSRLVAHAIVKMDGVDLCAIVVRNHLNWARFKSEFARDGARLLGKIQQKYVLGDKRYTGGGEQNLRTLAGESKLEFASLKDLAQEKSIPYIVVNDLNDPQAGDLLSRQMPDLIAFTGGGLVRKDILSIPRMGVLNCHTGILPQYRGMDVVEWTAAENRMEDVGFGATLHLMDQGVDSGPILIKKTLSPLPGDRFSTIRERLEALMVELMVTGVQKLRDDALQPQAQNPSDGRQFYVMHARVRACAEKRLARYLAGAGE